MLIHKFIVSAHPDNEIVNTNEKETPPELSLNA